jgi:hypothetical protein
VLLPHQIGCWEGDAFTNGRDFAAWLGLSPSRCRPGDRTILGKISRRGNRYLRVLFVQAAWVVLIKPKIWERYGLKPWIERPTKPIGMVAVAALSALAESVPHPATSTSGFVRTGSPANPASRPGSPSADR